MKSLESRYHNILHYCTPGLNSSSEIPIMTGDFIDCRPCYSLRGRLLDEESDTRGNTTVRCVSQASTLSLPLGIQVLLKKNQ